ncbi:MAG: hypothetical protein H0W86_04630 [Armatimonadetes bacterium]|nr:hypothetical protein [Armatimonadota bacterium]
MWSFSEAIDIMADPQELFLVVGNLMTRGHYWPDSVIAIREIAPRPFSETDKFLPGQRISFLHDGKQREHEIADAEGWDQAEATIIEKVLRSQKDEMISWRLSELYQGTYRVTITYSADYGTLDKVSKGKQVKAFYVNSLIRLKKYVEDRRSFAGARTYAPNPAPIDPLAP